MKIYKTVLKLSLVFLLSVSVLSGCNSRNQSTSSENTQQITTSDVQDIVIPLPDGWTKVDDPYVVVQYTKDSASFIVKTETFKSTTLEEIAKEDTDYLAKAFDKAKFIEPEKMQISGKEAIKVTFTDGEGTFSMKFETIIVKSSVSTYTITCGDLESSFNTTGFDKILSSIQFK